MIATAILLHYGDKCVLKKKEVFIMKKLSLVLTIVLLFSLIVMLTGCEKNSSYGSQKSTYTAKPTTNPSTESVPEKKEDSTSSTASKPKTDYNYQKEETKEWYSTTVAVSNAIIVEDNHKNNVIYKKKCDSCGHIEPGTISTNPGSFTSGFYCPNCKEQKTIKIETTYSH